MNALPVVVEQPRKRIYRSAELKAQLVALATAPGASTTGVAVAHGVNPNLLRRWVKQSQAHDGKPGFIPVKLESARPLNNALSDRVPVSQAADTHKSVAVQISKGDIRVQLDIDRPQMLELGAILREVLR